MSPRVVVEQVIRSWSTQDVESTLAHCGDDVVYSVNIAAEAAPFAGTSEGKDAVRAALHLMLEMFDYLKFDQVVVGVAGDVVRVQTQFKLHHRRTGSNLEGSMRSVFTVRNGLVARCEEYLDESLVEAFMRLVRQREAENIIFVPPSLPARAPKGGAGGPARPTSVPETPDEKHCE